MPTVVNEQAADAVNFNNVKTLGERSAMTAANAAAKEAERLDRISEIAIANMQLQMQSAQRTAESQAMLASALTGRIARYILDTSAEEAVSYTKQIGADLQDKIANLGAAVSAVQQEIKAAQTTAPQTGTGGAFGSDAGSALLQQVTNIGAIVAQLAAEIETLKTSKA